MEVRDIHDNVQQTYIADNFDGIMYLHADEDDTPKDMYAKMGFEIIDVLYEYSASWDK